MTNEYHPIVEVDESGVPIGPLDYNKAHPQKQTTLGISHLTTNILIFKNPSRDRVLLSLRGKEVLRPDRWDISAGGHAVWLTSQSRAQTPEEAAYKELDEELFSNSGIPKGLRLEQISSFWKRTRLNDQEFTHLFAGIYSGPFTPNPKEVAEIRFLGVEEALRDISKYPILYTTSVAICLNRFIEARK